MNPIFAPERHDDEHGDVPLDDLDLDELPPAGRGDPRDREQIEGPGGEPLHHDEDSLDEAPPKGDDAARSGFDSSVAQDLPVGLFDVVDDDRGISHGDSSGFGRTEDVGADDVPDFEDGGHRDLEPVHVPDDLTDDEELRPSPDDGGAEGTSEEIGAEVDENNLPELDADDGGAFDLDDFMRELQRGGFGYESDRDGWALYEGWGARVPCVALAVEAGRVVASGDELLVVEPRAHSARTASLPRRGTAIAASPEGAVVGTARGVLLASAESRVSSNASATSFMSMLDTEKPVRSLAVFGGRTWALVGDELWQIGSPPAMPLLARSNVLAMAAASDGLVVLVDGTDRSLERFRGDDGDWELIALSPEVKRAIGADDAPTIVLSEAGQTLALSCQTGVFVSREGGKHAAFIEIENVAGITFAGASSAPTLLIVVGQSTSLTIVAVDAMNRSRAEGRIELPSPLEGAADDSPQRISIAWDESREALFMATSSGLVAVGPRRPH